MVRRSRTGHVVDMFAGRTQRHVARALALGRLSPGGLRTVLGGGSKRQLVRTGFWRQMDNRRTATEQRGGLLPERQGRHPARSGPFGARARPGGPALVGWQGEVAVRWASGPQPACTPGADGGRYVTLWTLRDDGGTAARGPPRGPAAAPPSDPGPRGDAKRLLVRTGFWRQMDNQRTARSSMRKAG